MSKIKLVIEIPEQAYRFILQHGIKDTHEIDEIIANGTPITDDCISRSELLKHTEGGDYDGCGGFTPEYVRVEHIKNAPTIEKEN